MPVVLSFSLWSGIVNLKSKNDNQRRFSLKSYFQSRAARGGSLAVTSLALEFGRLRSIALQLESGEGYIRRRSLSGSREGGGELTGGCNRHFTIWIESVRGLRELRSLIVKERLDVGRLFGGVRSEERLRRLWGLSGLRGSMVLS
jgi:hypothetical protein